MAVLVDNTKPTMGKDAPTRELRAGLTALVTTLHASNPATEIGLWEFAGAGVMIQKPTVKTEDLTKRISRMFPGQQTGGVLLEALVDASKELSKKSAELRRAIVSVSFNSPETSTIEPRECAIAMKKAGVTYWAVSIQGNADASTKRQRRQSGAGADPQQRHRGDGRPSPHRGDRDLARTAAQVGRRSAGVAVSRHLRASVRRPDADEHPGVSKKGLKALTGPWVR